jgi:curved DNA-binding protein CbpA
MTEGNKEYVPRTAYEILGVCADASHDEIRAAYRRAVLLAHPDKALADDADVRDGAALEEGFRELQTAWKVCICLTFTASSSNCVIVAHL